MEELISVIVPVYNCEAYIERCTESIFNQDYGNIELILVDDGSTDSSGSIIDRIAAEHDNVTALHRSNGGAASARREGILRANGDYITFVDCDDWVDREIYTYLYSLIKSGDYGASCCTYRLTGEGYPDCAEDRAEEVNSYGFDDMIKNFYKDTLWSSCAKLYRRELFSEDDYTYNFAISEDYIFNYKILSKCNQIIVSNKQYYCYFRHSGSAVATSTLTAEKIRDSLSAYRLIEADIDKSTRAYKHHIANIILNDFDYLIKIEETKCCYECFDELRNEIIGYMSYIFMDENRYAFNIKKMLIFILLRLCPSAFRLVLRIKVKLC